MTNRDKNIVGQILAKTYRIERFLGVGTVGTVYVARHVRSGGLYAVKVLHRKLAASPDLYQRFQDEARLIATLRHPHILPITDFDRDENGIPFFVMDLLEGENLQQRLKHKETLPIAQVLEIVQQVGSALHTAHRSGIVHRNIKPENIFLVRHDLGDRVTETAKIMDFGLARFRRMAPAGTRDASLGVSAYMAPEMLQETNTPIDGRADQWALAVIAYRMLTGKPPFEDENPEEMLRQIINEPPRPFPRMTPEMPAHLAAAIHRGMAKRREDRYETLMDFVRALSSRPSTAGVETVATPPSGRVVAPMPPIPSGAVPPPTPAAAQAPRPMPPMPSTPSKATPAPAPVAAPTPSRATPAPAPAPSAVSPPQPPPILHAPPLLIPEEAKAAPPPPPRGPSWGLLIGGGALALMAGVGATLLWERGHRPRPPITTPVTQTAPTDVGTGQLVVEPLVPAGQNAADGAAAPAPTKGPVAPQVPVPPLRAFGDDTAPTPAPTEPAAPTAPTPAPAAPAPTQVAPTPTPVPTPAQATQPAKPPAGTPTAATPPSAVPAPATATRPATPAQPVPGPAPSAQPVQPTQPAASPGQRNPVRDEVDELIGPTGPAKPAQPTQPPAATQPAVPARPVTSAPAQPGTAPGAATQRPTQPQRPPAAKPVDPEADSGEKTADKLLEDAQASYVRGERQRAIELALQVTKTGTPADVTKAWRFIGSAACSVRSASLATRAYQNLPTPEHRQLLTELCKRNGLNFSDGQFIAE